MIGLGSNKQILVVGNDGVQLYVLKGKSVSLYQDFSDTGGSLTGTLKHAFKTVNLPMIVLFDVLEQQYRRETIPKVNFLDKSKVINRKLAMAFPQQLFRAFLLSKQKPREGETNVALFAGLSGTLTITQIMDAILSSEVYVEGAALLPLESISLVVKLVEQARKSNNTRGNPRWSVLMTHHKTGGLRQIVIKDGELALTRMTPLAASVDHSEALAEEMAREFNATLTYLSRFGYVPTDGLDLYIVSTPETGQRLQNYRLPVTELYPLTLSQAMDLVGLKAARNNDNEDYGEILHAGWVGMQSKLLVPLSSQLLDKIKQARQSARVLIFALIIGIAYVGWQITSLQSTVSTVGNDLASQQKQKQSLQNDLAALTKKLDTLKLDPDKTKALLDVYDENYKKSLDIQPMMNALMPMMDHSKFLMKEIAITQENAGANAVVQAAFPSPAGDSDDLSLRKPVTISMEISFPPSISVEQSARNTLEFADALRKRFPGRTITITGMIGDLASDRIVQGKSEKAAPNALPDADIKNQTSKIEFKGMIE
jgi:hypothetical protein